MKSIVKRTASTEAGSSPPLSSEEPPFFLSKVRSLTTTVERDPTCLPARHWLSNPRHTVVSSVNDGRQ